METTVYVYNDKNDIVAEIIAYDINHPDELDTTLYEYTYANEVIAFEKRVPASKDSAI